MTVAGLIALLKTSPPDNEVETVESTSGHAGVVCDVADDKDVHLIGITAIYTRSTGVRVELFHNALGSYTARKPDTADGDSFRTTEKQRYLARQPLSLVVLVAALDDIPCVEPMSLSRAQATAKEWFELGPEECFRRLKPTLRTLRRDPSMLYGLDIWSWDGKCWGRMEMLRWDEPAEDATEEDDTD